MRTKPNRDGSRAQPRLSCRRSIGLQDIVVLLLLQGWREVSSSVIRRKVDSQTSSSFNQTPPAEGGKSEEYDSGALARGAALLSGVVHVIACIGYQPALACAACNRRARNSLTCLKKMEFVRKKKKSRETAGKQFINSDTPMSAKRRATCSKIQDHLESGNKN